VTKRFNKRIWKLKHLDKSNDGDKNVHAMKKKSAKERANLEEREQADYNEFL